MPNVQIHKHSGVIENIKIGETPTLALDLRPAEYVVSVSLEEVPSSWKRVASRDWRWSAFIVSPQ